MYVVTGILLAGILSISGQPGTSEATDSFEVNYTFSCTGCEKKPNYFFGALKPADATRYFGLNQVVDSWLNYEVDKNASLFSMASPSAEGTWSGKLVVKPIDAYAISTLFKGAGNYILKVFRFTPSSTSDATEAGIILSYTPPTQPSPEATAGTATPSPTPMATPPSTITSTPFPTPKPTPKVTPEPTVNIGTVAGTILEPTPTPQPTILPTPKAHYPIPIIITLGGLMIVGGILPFGLRYTR